VVGAGAVGRFLGEALRGAGCDVIYAPRDAGRAVPLGADLAIVAVKAYDTEAAIATLQNALVDAPDCTILTPQNGVGNEEQLAVVFGPDRIVSGALTVPVERLSDGSFVAANRGGLGLAPVGSVAHNWLMAAFARTPIPVSAIADYRAMKWSKLALNIIANASCAILDVLPERLVRFDGIFELELRAIREARAVMAALDLSPVDLPRYPVRALFGLVSLPDAIARTFLARRIAGARGLKPPSLLLDVRAARGRTEVSALNGAIATAGAALGIATPVNAAYAGVLARIAADPSVWATYRERPAALLAAVVSASAMRGVL
jgi:2-dehydropantoate 2-reductase